MVGISDTTANERKSYLGTVGFFSDTYPSITPHRGSLFCKMGTESRISVDWVRSCLVKKQDERLDSKTFSQLTKVGGCGNVRVVLSSLNINSATS